MKFLNKIFLIAMLSIVMVGCNENDEFSNFDTADVDFVYSVDGDQYPLDFYVVSTIQFTNTSSKSGAVSWDFGDGTTSTEANPTHKYAASGFYDVTLKVDGVGSISYPLMITDITTVPSITAQSDETLVINDVTVEIGIFLPNPEELKTKFTWTFPEGTVYAETGEEATEPFIGYYNEDGTIDYPGALSFKHIGSQKIIIQTQFDIEGEKRALAEASINVQVGCSYECPTIYYSVYEGNIMALKLVDESLLPEGTIVSPFDMGVGSGSMSQQIVFVTKDSSDEEGNIVANDELFILDCGSQYTFVDDSDANLGDGKINVMSADGSSVNTLVSNVGQTAFYDPFQGCSDGEYIYYTDRNTGIKKRALTERGATEVTDYTDATYLVTNDELGYYGRGIGYGAIHSGIYLDRNGMFWWPKNYSGNGIYRFKTSDIGQTNAIPYPIVLSSCQPKAFTLDEDRDKMYVWFVGGSPGEGFGMYDIPADDEGASVTQTTSLKYITMYADPINATASEGVYVTQFAVDSRDGNVYFGFRPGSTEKTYTSNGLYYFDYDSQSIEAVDGITDAILGVAINSRATKLF